MPARSQRPRPVALLAALAAACDRAPSPPPRRPPPPEDVADVAPSPAGGLCARRASPPVDLRRAPGCGPPEVAWSGSHFGAAWVEDRGGEPSVTFARVDGDGALLGTPQRVSERGFWAASPALAWNGASWSVVYSGGVRAYGDLYQARVDARGIPLGRPWRTTRGARQDLEPVLVSTGPGYGLGWVAREEDGRGSLHVQSQARWNEREVEPTRLINTPLALASPRLVWTGQAWAATALVVQREAKALVLMRMEADGAPRGVLTRLTRTAPGGVETAGRYAVAWSGTHFVAAWSELRDGALRVFLRRYTNRGNALGDEAALPLGDATSAAAPALARVGDGVLALAAQVEREGVARVRVWVLGPDGAAQRDPVELQGIDGQATRPSLAWSGERLGVGSVSPRGVTFHAVALGPCEATE